MRKRLDQYLADRGLFESRARAKAAVMEGLVSVDGSNQIKPGTQVSGNEDITVSEGDAGYVSRGGNKLAHALETFGIDINGSVVFDVGSSTGGFTDCLLRRGAAHVTAVDVGKGLLHWKLRGDPRVSILEGCNARSLSQREFTVPPNLAVIDVSFISLTKVLQPVFEILAADGQILALVKPQFEAGRKYVEKGGVVRNPAAHLQVLKNIANWLAERGMVMKAVALSPLKGPKGNIEFFIWITGRGDPIGEDILEQEVMKAHV